MVESLNRGQRLSRASAGMLGYRPVTMSVWRSVKRSSSFKPRIRAVPLPISESGSMMARVRRESNFGPSQAAERGDSRIQRQAADSRAGFVHDDEAALLKADGTLNQNLANFPGKR